MRSVHEEPVEVARSGDSPEQFLLHGRLHVVRAVLARWVEPGGWRWSGPGQVAPVAAAAVAAGGGAAVVPDGAAGTVRRRSSTRCRSTSPTGSCGGWRPRPGCAARLQVFDLCRDTATAPSAPPRWTATLVEE